MMTQKNQNLHEAVGFARRLYDRGFTFLAFLVMVMAFVLNGENVREAQSMRALGTVETESRSQWRADASQWLTSQATRIARDLRTHGIPNATVYSRVKSEESAREKAERRGVEMHELNDLYGMRVVVDNELAVYQCLNYLCNTYSVIPGTLKNYIVSPKPSGYRSVHVVAQVNENRVEFQLRTREMHWAAEEEHEAYKARMRSENVA